MNRDNAGADKEYSAGGVITRGEQVLLIQATTLKGEKVWTFPKGHLESGETARAAALREVEEETGWRCRIVKRLPLLRYVFTRDGRRIAKKVQWYWMEPEVQTGEPDPKEISATRWTSFERAAALVRYPTDVQLLGDVGKLAAGKSVLKA